MWPLGDRLIKIGMLGFTEGNGHPYSWSAMLNGYDADAMCGCGFSTIPEYLGLQPAHTMANKNARVTHVCCTGFAERAEAKKIAQAANIGHVVDRPEDMIGQVDAVIVATDIGAEHVERCSPFVEAGIPMFVDKPLVDCERGLRQFVKWYDSGAKFISSSSMRYTKELEPFYQNHYELGRLMYICQSMPKKYETYGIHALETMYPLLGAGFEWAQNTGTYERAMVHLYHESGCYVDIPMGIGMCGGGTLILGSAGKRYIDGGDSYYSFKKQLDLFVEWLRTGVEPVSFEDTVELMKLVIAGLRSREEGGRRVMLSEIKER